MSLHVYRAITLLLPRGVYAIRQDEHFQRTVMEYKPFISPRQSVKTVRGQLEEFRSSECFLLQVDWFSASAPLVGLPLAISHSRMNNPALICRLKFEHARGGVGARTRTDRPSGGGRP